MESWVTLREWAHAYFERPPAYETVVRYAREDLIQPKPVIVDGVYRVSPDAMLVRPKRGQFTRGNVQHG